jgi:hypothetical protein
MRAMRFTATLNAAFYRMTGYRLTRETPEQRREAIRLAKTTAAQRARQRAAGQQAAARSAAEKRRAEEQAARRARGGHLPRHFDDVKREIIAKALPRTMTGLPKLDPLVEAVRYVVRYNIPGDIVECGVWRGGSMLAMALTLASLGDTTRALHLFDTFEGMPPPTAEDTRKRITGETVSAAEALATHARDSKVWAVAGLDDVREAMEQSGYPLERVHYHVGMVEDTVPDEAPGQIAILRLDTDWYASTKHELETLYDRLSPGGVLMLDDYGDWEGARKATDEWLEVTGEVLFLVPMGSGRIAVKPPAPTG